MKQTFKPIKLDKTTEIKNLLIDRDASHGHVHEFLQHLNETKIKNEVEGKETDELKVYYEYSDGKVIVHHLSVTDVDMKAAGANTTDKADDSNV